jgi:L-iditol 2-dehydrogenase/galactitol-1-phosphate 5-dehydrogenase
MKALVLIKNAHLEYKEVPLPVKPTKDSYLIRVVAAGICGSDIHRAFENGAYHYPLIMGHEFSGIIEEDFPGARYKKKERISVYPIIPCKKCRACLDSDYVGCNNYDYLGSRRDGAFAEFVYAPEENIFSLPGYVDIFHAAMTEPCAVALHGVRKFNITGGETAVIIGGGPIGNIAAQWLRIYGCKRIIIVEIDEKKLKIAEEMGFETINPANTNPVKEIYLTTKNEGANKVVEACGLPLTYRQAIQSVGRLGEVLFLGTINSDLVIDPDVISHILRSEITLYGTWNSQILPLDNDDWSTVLKYMDKELHVAPLISHTPKLEDGVDIFRKIVSKREYFNKIIFKIYTGK